jgi:hypothetical protein
MKDRLTRFESVFFVSHHVELKEQSRINRSRLSFLQLCL